jgi:hypothetical protein
VKTKPQRFKKNIKWDKIKTWLAPLSAMVIAIVAVFGIYHQARLEEENRSHEHQKWEATLQAQIQLSETNRERDFLVWQRQRSEEWTQQFLSLQAQQKKLDSSEKEGLYQDFVFHLQRVFGLIQAFGWSKWRLYCYAEEEITMPRKSSVSEIQKVRERLSDEAKRWENKVEKEQAELDEEKVVVLRLMQSVKLKYSDTLQYPIDVGLNELNRLPIGIPSSPEVDALIHKIFQNGTNEWYALADYYGQNLRKYTKPERFEKTWEDVDEMMWREITLERKGIEIKPEYLTNSGPFVFSNGMSLTFTRDDFEKNEFNFNADTNKIDQAERR